MLQWKSILLPFFVVILCLIIIEGVARMVIYPKQSMPNISIIPHPVLNHTWNPHVSGISIARGRPYRLYANKQGWVEHDDVSVKKSPSTYRIFFVGDSNVEGVVNTNNKMEDLVDKELNERFKGRGINFEVINTGTKSYSTVIYYLLIKTELLKYAPDLIVINMDMTDVPDDFYYRPLTRFDADGHPTAVLPEDTMIKKEYVLTPFGRLKLSWIDKIDLKLSEWSAFYRWVASQLVKETNPSLRYMDRSANWLSLTWDQQIQDNVNYSMGILELIMELLKEQGVKFYITGVPHFPQYTGKYSTKPLQVLKETVELKGGLYLDSFAAMEPYIKNSRQADYYWAGDPGHFNESGNALWAAVHLKFLTYPENKLLPQELTDH